MNRINEDYHAARIRYAALRGLILSTQDHPEKPNDVLEAFVQYFYGFGTARKLNDDAASEFKYQFEQAATRCNRKYALSLIDEYESVLWAQKYVSLTNAQVESRLVMVDPIANAGKLKFARSEMAGTKAKAVEAVEKVLVEIREVQEDPGVMGVDGEEFKAMQEAAEKRVADFSGLPNDLVRRSVGMQGYALKLRSMIDKANAHMEYSELIYASSHYLTRASGAEAFNWSAVGGVPDTLSSESLASRMSGAHDAIMGCITSREAAGYAGITQGFKPKSPDFKAN